MRILSPTLWTSEPSKRWTTGNSFPRIYAGNVTIYAPHNVFRSIAPGKLTSDERSIVHRVAPHTCHSPEYIATHSTWRRVMFAECLRPASGGSYLTPQIKTSPNTIDSKLVQGPGFDADRRIARNLPLVVTDRLRAKKQLLEKVLRTLAPEIHGQRMASTVLCVTHSLGSD